MFSIDLGYNFRAARPWESLLWVLFDSSKEVTFPLPSQMTHLINPEELTRADLPHSLMAISATLLGSLQKWFPGKAQGCCSHCQNYPPQVDPPFCIAELVQQELLGESPCLCCEQGCSFLGHILSRMDRAHSCFSFLSNLYQLLEALLLLYL